MTARLRLDALTPKARAEVVAALRLEDSRPAEVAPAE